MLVDTQLLGFVRRSIYADATQITDEQLLEIINQYFESIGQQNNKRCLILYNSILSALQYLAARWNIDIAAATGGAIERTERVGQVEVSTKFNDSDIYADNPWQRLHDAYFYGQMQVIGCPMQAKASDNVLIGGVDRSEIHRVKDNCNSVDGLQGFYNKNRHWDLRRG